MYICSSAQDNLFQLSLENVSCEAIFDGIPDFGLDSSKLSSGIILSATCLNTNPSGPT